MKRDTRLNLMLMTGFAAILAAGAYEVLYQKTNQSAVPTEPPPAQVERVHEGSRATLADVRRDWQIEGELACAARTPAPDAPPPDPDLTFRQ